MDNKDKIIEEMAEILLQSSYVWWREAPNGTTKKEYQAKTLYNAGYRKLPEDSVVLSREEYESDLTAQYNVAYEMASKETAEKILKDFKLWAREYQYKDTLIDDKGERPMTSNEKLNYLYTYLCDKYNVEIKENRYEK